MKKALLFLISMIYLSPMAFSQSENVGVNTTSPDNSAALHVTYVTTPKGVLVPRMTTAERGNIPAPIANGLLIFNTTTNRFEVYDSGATTWRGLLTTNTANSVSWSRTGNAGTTPGTDFLGTTDNTAFTLFTNNTERLRLNANGNFGVGTNNPLGLFSVGNTSQFQVNGTGAISAATGITSSGNIIFSGLTADQFLRTTTGGQLTTFGFSQDLNVTNTGTATVTGIRGRTVSTSAPLDGQILKWNSTLSEWVPANDDGSMGGGNTLEQAYNQGGAGSGRSVDVTDGAVQLLGNDSDDEALEVSNSNNGGAVYINNTGSGNTLLVESNGDTTLTVQTDGKVKIGENGTGLVNIIRATINYDLPNLAPNDAASVFFSVANAEVGSTVMISPHNSLTDDIAISYARVSSAGNIEVRFANVGDVAQNLGDMNFYITVIK